MNPNLMSNDNFYLFPQVIDTNSSSHLSSIPISSNWSSLWHRQFWCYIRMIMCSFTMPISSIMNLVTSKDFCSLTCFLAILWVKHVVKDSRWGISCSLEGSKNGFLVWGLNITLRGFTWSRRLSKSSSVLGGCRSRILGVPCLAGLQLRREG